MKLNQLSNASLGHVLIPRALKRLCTFLEASISIAISLLPAKMELLLISVLKPFAMRAQTKLIAGLLNNYVKFAHQLQQLLTVQL